MADLLTTDNDFKIKFDGQVHQIDANVLINSLIHTTTVIQEINKYIDSGKRIEIKIKALEKGSFLIHIEILETVIGALQTIFSKETIPIGGTIIGILVGLIKIKEHLQGRKPKEIEKCDDTIKITNDIGNVFVIEQLTYNIYDSNSVVKDSLAHNFDAINNDSSITGFEITDRNEKPYVKIDRDQFVNLSIKSEDISNNEKLITEAATLNIVRLSFEGNLKWEFYYKGNRISAKIKDENFQKSIDNGEMFSKGDVLEVELQIIQCWEESVRTYVNKSYQVNKIIRHIPRDVEQKLDFQE